MTYIGAETQQVARAAAALPAAGAWDAAPVEMYCCYAQRVTLYFTYTRGGAGGAFDFQVQVSPYSLDTLAPAGAQAWMVMSLYDSGGVAAGVDSQSRAQREYITYQATGAAAEAFVYGPIEMAHVERLRVRARESGAVGAPGTLQIEAGYA